MERLTPDESQCKALLAGLFEGGYEFAKLIFLLKQAVLESSNLRCWS